MAQTETLTRTSNQKSGGDAENRRPRSELFQRIQKRDGSIVDFNKTKIADAIFKAAQSVGGKDRRLSDELADRVILYLANRFEGNLLNIEDVQDAVEKILIENGHARTVKAYILYRQERTRIRRLQKGPLESADLRDLDQPEAGHADVLVETSSDKVVRWDRERIVNALVRETGMVRRIARKVASEIESQIVYAKIHRVTAALIREMVNAKLIEYGFEEERRMHTRLGVPRYDVERVLTSTDPARRATTPAQADLFLAESIAKQFAANRVYPQSVIDAHLNGDIHIHDLDHVNRLGSFLISPEYVKKFGPLGDDGYHSSQLPGSYLELVEALVNTLAVLSAHGDGQVGFDSINVFLAPFLVNRSGAQIEEAANHLVSRLAAEARKPGMDSHRVDVHLTWDIPRRLRDVPATAEGGVSTGEAYGYYEKEARDLTVAILEACGRQSTEGFPIRGIRPIVHLTDEVFRVPGGSDFLEFCAGLATSTGLPAIAMDRDDILRAAPFGRWSPENSESFPWKVRAATLQTVTLNLPRAAYRGGGDERRILDQISDCLNMAVKAHAAKRAFIDRLIAAGNDGPYRMLLCQRDGEPFLRSSRLRMGIGLVGLTEMAEAHLDENFLASVEPLKFILRVLAHLHLECKRLSTRDGVSYVLSTTPGTHAAPRLAAIDLETFRNEAGRIFGDDADPAQEAYSIGLPMAGEEDNLVNLCKREGKFHDLVEGNIETDFILPEEGISPKVLAGILEQVYQRTRNVQVAFTPERTVCRDCGAKRPGLHDVCASCHSSRVSRLIRVDGHFRSLEGPLPPRARAGDLVEWVI